MIHLGYFGGLQGPGQPARVTLAHFLMVMKTKHRGARIHHAGQTPGDLDFHCQARALGVSRVIHPTNDASLAAYADEACSYAITTKTTVLAPQPLLTAFSDIVEQTELILVCPFDGRTPADQQAMMSALYFCKRPIFIDHAGEWEER